MLPDKESSGLRGQDQPIKFKKKKTGLEERMH